MINKGKDIAEITELTGFQRSQIFELRKQFLLSGITALPDKRKKSPNELLTKKQRQVEDEMSLSAATTIQKIWLPQGEYPQIEVSSRKESRSIYGFLNIKTKQEHAFKTEWQNMYITSAVLTKLRKIYPTEKILLIWDQGPWHRGSKAQEFIKQDKNIRTIYFPRGAPEENPQEHVWKNGRSQVTHNKFIQKIDQTTAEFVTYLNATKFNYSFLCL